MNFWNEENLKEALPYAQLFNFPPHWSGCGLFIWHDELKDNSIILVRRPKEKRGLLPQNIDRLIDKVSAIVSSDVTAFFKYNKPLIEINGSTDNVIIDLARYIRKNYQGTVVAITGSSGKSTTTKMVYDVLSSKFKTSANLNRYNTSWGLSWNMTCFDIDAKYWAIETSLGGGMNRNSAITKPDYAIITNIAPVHVNTGMTLKNIAETKAQIFNYMTPGACAIIYREAEYFKILKSAAEYKELKIITYGESEDCDIRVIADDTSKFILGGQEYIFQDSPVAKHILLDMAAAIAVAKEEGFNTEKVLEVLRNFSQVEGRGNQIELTLSGDRKIKLIDESYNANPLSMQAALEGFAHLFPDKNKIVILGDMAECGPDSAKYHAGISETIRKVNPQKLILCGKEMKYLFDEIKDEFDCKYYETVKELNPEIVEILNDNDHVFIKSSHSTELYKTVDTIKKAGI